MAEPPVELLRAIAHPMRYAILAALSGKELNVGQIEEATRIGQPTLSQQLSILRKAGLVDSRRESRLVFYAIKPAPLVSVVEGLRDLIPCGTEAPAGTGRPRRPIGAAAFARMD